MQIRILLLVLFSGITALIFGQIPPQKQELVVQKEYVVDHEKLFTESEKQELNTGMSNCWKKGIAEIAIVTLDDRHTDKANFEKYVAAQLTSYALGENGKNNGIVIALSKKLQKIHIVNGYGSEKILDKEISEKIIEQYFLPKFKEGKYFDATLNGLNELVSTIGKLPKQEDYTNATAIFSASIFKKIRNFVLENGTPQTFRNMDNDNPSYNFTSLDVFFGPSRKSSFVLKDFLEDDYYEMTIRDNNGSYYQFVYFDKKTPEQTFIHKEMQPEKVYWLRPGSKFLSSDVWPLLAQIEDEIAQKSAVNQAKPITQYRWILQQEFHPMERIYTDIDNHDVLSFNGNDVFINGKKEGSFQIKPEERILSLKINEGKQPAFAIFKMEDRYYYRYVFNKEQRKLYLVPLDEKEGNDLICVEGCTLVFDVSE